MSFERKKIGEILVDMGSLAPAELRLELDRQAASGRRLGETALSGGMIDDQVLAQALARQFGLEYFDLEGAQLPPELLEMVTPDLMLRFECVAVRHEDDLLTVAVADPTRLQGLDDLEMLVDRRIALVVAPREQLASFIERGRGSQQMLQGVSEDFKLQLVKETDKGEEVLSIEKLTEDASPIIRLIDSTLFDALNKRASDIHIESSQDGVVIKYRVDGLLFRATEPLDARFQGPIISRIKVMSELDIAERRIPQDGRFKVRMGGKSIDFRVSIMPSIHGEDAVIRILDKESIAKDLHGLTLDVLGIDERELVRFRRMIREPYGMVLVTGPTGSGKTTTLYGAISEIYNEQEKLVTIEDPVEYQLRGVVQIPVNEKKGLTFARGLRSILRHDPDKIMVGEIRDPETAQIAVQSALTGHLVFTTVHANNVFDVLGRFLHMGIDPFNFVSCLNCVAAQRLIRKICPHCRRPLNHSRETLEAAGLYGDLYLNHTYYEGAGCRECNGQGYHGRTAIVELLDITDDLREMIVAKTPVTQLKEAARAAGTRFLREAAVAKLLAGVTTLEEINRVTFIELAGQPC